MSDPGPQSSPRNQRATRATVKVKSQEKDLILRETINKLLLLRKGQPVLVRNKHKSWCLCNLSRRPEIVSEGTDEKIAVVRVHVQPPSGDRPKLNAGIQTEIHFLTGGSVLVAVPEHTAPGNVSVLSARTISGGVVNFGKVVSNILIHTKQRKTDHVETEGQSYEAMAVQDRYQPLLQKYAARGSASCPLRSINPTLDLLMNTTRRGQEQNVYLFTPTAKYVKDLVNGFTHHVPGENKGIDVVKLITPFLGSANWRVTAFVIAPSMPSNPEDIDSIS